MILELLPNLKLYYIFTNLSEDDLLYSFLIESKPTALLFLVI